MTQTEPVRPDHPPQGRSFNARFSRGLSRLLAKLKVDDVPHIKRIIVTVVGGTIVILGAMLVVTPVPGALIILGGLAVLGTEYAWARRWMRTGRIMANKALSRTQKILAPKEKGSYQALEASMRADQAALSAAKAEANRKSDIR